MIVKKTTTLWIISYILVLILPIAINLVSYISVENMMMSQVVKNNQYILERKRESIDNFLEGMIEISSSCITQDEINRFAELSAPLSPEDKFQMAKITRQWLIAKNTVGVDNIYVYLPKSDFVIGTTRMNTPELFFISQYGSREAFQKWYSYVVQDKEVGFRKIQSDKQERLLYVCILKNSPLGDYAPVVVIEVDVRNLAQTLGDDNSSFFVFDDNNNLIVKTGADAEVEGAVTSIDWQKYSDPSRIRAGGKDLIASYEKSASSQWRYVYAIDRNKYMKSIIAARLINYIGLCISVLLGMVLIRVSVKRHHKPLERLVDQLQRDSKRVRDDPDDYRYISRLISNAMAEKSELQTAATLQRKTLWDNVLSKLLKGYSQEREMNGLLRTFDISFPYENFTVGAIYIDDVSEIFFEQGGDEEEQLRQAQFIICNVLEELLRQCFVSYVFKCDDILCFLVNSEDCGSVMEEQIAGCIHETHSFVKNNFNFSFISVVSDGVQGMNNICVAYDQTMEMLECRFMLDDETILTQQEIEKKSGGDYYYPLKKEQEIINAVKNGDYEAALSILNEVLDKNFRESHMSGQLAKCLIFDILCTIIKSIKEINTESDQQYLDSLNLYSRLTECTSLNAMRDELVCVLKEICSNINQGEKKRNILVDKAIEYVQAHYDDENLSVAMVAEACAATPNYLSLVFKKNMCVGLLDYISGFRIEKAKILLSFEKNMSIEEVANHVGYVNVRTFTRIFRKYELVTPTQYRQNLR